MSDAKSPRGAASPPPPIPPKIALTGAAAAAAAQQAAAARAASPIHAAGAAAAAAAPTLNEKEQALLVEGRSFLKYGRFGKPHACVVKCSPDLTTIKWGDKQALTSEMTAVMSGRKTAVFKKYPAKGSERSLSLVFASRSLDLDVERQPKDGTAEQLSDEKIRDDWVGLFGNLHAMMQHAIKTGRPFNVKHQVHVNKNFEWSSKDGKGKVEETFELREKLGAGAFGAVYKAVHRAGGFALAAKLITIENPDVIEELKNEIDVLKQCKHPSIVAYYGCAGPDDKNRLWVLMDLASAGAMSSLLRDADGTTPLPLSEPQIAYAMASTLRALAYLHGRKIIHRDVKAANILLTEDGLAKLADFGVSEKTKLPVNEGGESGDGGGGAVDDSAGADDDSKKSIAGSPLWMAPETFKGDASYASDIWSLGITAIELAECEPPYAHSNLTFLRLSRAITSHNPPTLKEPKKWSDPFHDFLAKILVKEPAKRPTAAQLLAHPFVAPAVTALMLATTPGLPAAAPTMGGVPITGGSPAAAAATAGGVASTSADGKSAPAGGRRGSIGGSKMDSPLLSAIKRKRDSVVKQQALEKERERAAAAAAKSKTGLFGSSSSGDKTDSKKESGKSSSSGTAAALGSTTAAAVESPAAKTVVASGGSRGGGSAASPTPGASGSGAASPGLNPTHDGDDNGSEAGGGSDDEVVVSTDGGAGGRDFDAPDGPAPIPAVGAGRPSGVTPKPLASPGAGRPPKPASRPPPLPGPGDSVDTELEVGSDTVAVRVRSAAVVDVPPRGSTLSPPAAGAGGRKSHGRASAFTGVTAAAGAAGAGAGAGDDDDAFARRRKPSASEGDVEAGLAGGNNKPVGTASGASAAGAAHSGEADDRTSLLGNGGKRRNSDDVASKAGGDKNDDSSLPRRLMGNRSLWLGALGLVAAGVIGYLVWRSYAAPRP